MKKLFLAALILILSAPLLPAGERHHQVETEDYFSIAVITGLAQSPDGKKAAITEMRWEPPAEHRNTDLWITDVPTGETTRLTFGPADVSGARFSPDGAWIYYTSTCGDDGGSLPCNGKQQIWRIAPDGTREMAVTREENGVGSFDLSGDGTFVLYSTKGETAEDQWEDLRSRFSELDYANAPAEYSTLRRLDLKDWRKEDLASPERVVLDLDLGMARQYCALITTPDTELVYREGWSRVDLMDLETGKFEILTPDGWRQGHPSPYGWIDSVRISDDEEVVAFSVSFDGYPTRLYVSEKAADGWKLSQLSVPGEPSIVGGSVGWKPASHDLIFLGEDHARVRLYSFENVHDGKGEFKTLTPGEDVSLDSWSFNAAGNSPIVVSSAPDDGENLYTLDSDGGMHRITDINPQIDQWILPEIERVSWKTPDGITVEGILETPAGWKKEDGPLPMIVEIHGGPSASTLYRMRFWIYGRTLLPAHGYAVLSPNYRGSTGYGDRFMTDLVGHENEIEVGDILAGVDAMVSRGIADPDRLGVMGWSNGGFLTDALIAATDRFKAASSGAGVIDQSIQWATEDTPGHVINFMRGLPWENPEAYIKGSPLFGVGSVTTPTLIHVGGADPRVPPAHSRALYRALKLYLKVPVELVIYPGAHHGLSTYTHRKAKMEWDLAWFEKYLGKPSEESSGD